MAAYLQGGCMLMAESVVKACLYSCRMHLAGRAACHVIQVIQINASDAQAHAF